MCPGSLSFRSERSLPSIAETSGPRNFSELFAFDADPCTIEDSLRILDLFYARYVARSKTLLRNLLDACCFQVMDERVRIIHPLVRMEVLPNRIKLEDRISPRRGRASKSQLLIQLVGSKHLLAGRTIVLILPLNIVRNHRTQVRNYDANNASRLGNSSAL